MSGLAALLYAVPSYWLGLMLVAIFSVRLGWLPVSQMGSATAAGGPFPLADAALHMVLPCLALALPAAGGIALFVPEVLGTGYRPMDAALNMQYAWQTMAVLAAAKLLVAGLAFAVGTPGGLFAPTLFLGVMLGGTFALLGVERPADLAAARVMETLHARGALIDA